LLFIEPHRDRRVLVENFRRAIKAPPFFPAMSGLAFAIVAFTAGSDSEA